MHNEIYPKLSNFSAYAKNIMTKLWPTFKEKSPNFGNIEKKKIFWKN